MDINFLQQRLEEQKQLSKDLLAKLNVEKYANEKRIKELEQRVFDLETGLKNLYKLIQK